MRAQTQKQNPSFQSEWAKTLKTLEINPNSPLIEGLLRRIEQLPSGEEDEKDTDAEEELKEVASILVDSALVRSGFEVADPNMYFTRVDHVLRRSLGVSQTAKTDTTVKPAPPVAEGPLPETDDEPEMPFGGNPSFGGDFMDFKDFKAQQAAKGEPIPDDIKVSVEPNLGVGGEGVQEPIMHHDEL